MNLRCRIARAGAAAVIAVGWNVSFAATVVDFNSWTEIQDPPHPGLTSSIDTASQVTLSANGAVPAATDIGFQSVDGTDVAGSAAGHYFPVSSDFQIAIDFDVTATNSVGLAAVGFGIGEDAAGANSAGAVLAILNGSALAFSGGARVNDVTQPPAPLALAASSSGRFFIDFDATTGDIHFGASPTPGAAAPAATGTFSGAVVQNLWNGDDLLVSFFLRSDTLPPILPTPLSAGSLDAVFSNFEVLAGAPASIVPLPGAAALLLAGMLLLAGRNLRPLN